MFETITDLTQWTSTQAELFFLVLIRVVSIVFLLPFFSSDLMIPQLKIGLSFFISLILFSTIPPQTIVIPESLIGFIAIIIREILVGVVIGFSTVFLFTGFEICAPLARIGPVDVGGAEKWPATCQTRIANYSLGRLDLSTQSDNDTRPLPGPKLADISLPVDGWC